MNRCFERLTTRIVAAALLCLLAAAATAAPGVDEAISLFDHGKVAEAKAAFDTILTTNPSEPRALYYAARINAAVGKPQIAIQQILLLLKIAPSWLPALELQVQVYQALGETDRRDAAIDRLRAERGSSLNPGRFALAFIRDRFTVGGRTYLVSERFDPSGETIIRYIVADESVGAEARHMIMLLSDPETNDRWREVAKVSSSALVYHLDTVDPGPDGDQVRRPYVNYVGAPDYDTVRALVMDILSGRAKPMSGEPDPYWTNAQ